MKLKTILIFSALASILLGCSQVKPDGKNDLNSSQAKAISSDEFSTNEESLGDLKNQDPEEEIKVFRIETIKACDGCVKGSSKVPDDNDTVLLDVDKGMFYLAGAEDYGLKNLYFDIPVLLNHSTKKWITYFSSRGRDYLTEYLKLSGRYAPVMGHMLQERGMPRDLIFLAMAESGFQNKAKSKAKAVGPWQFIKATGRKYNLRIDWYVDERRDPIKSTIAASNYLHDLKKLFGSWELAAAAYNAGEGKIARAIKKYKTQSFWDIRDGHYLRKETKNYVPKIMSLAIIGKNLTSFGFNDVEFMDTLEYETVDLPPLSDLIKVTELMDWSWEELTRWNPELLRWFTPPDRQFSLRVPVGMGIRFKPIKSEEIKLVNFKVLELKQNTSLTQVAKNFNVPSSVLKELNPNLGDSEFVLKGSSLNLPFREGQTGQEKMYADLFEKKSNRKKMGSSYYEYLRVAKKKGLINLQAKQFYTIEKGDTLWQVSKKTGVPLEQLIRSNYNTVENGLKPGEKLAIR